MRDQLRLVAWLLMVTGGLMLLVSAFADPLALGMPGSSFGWKQAMGCVLGGLIAFGGWRFHARLDRADARDDQRARQRRAAAAAAPPTATHAVAADASLPPAQAVRQAAAGVAPVPRPPVVPAPVAAPATYADDDADDLGAWTTSPAPVPDIRANLAATRAMADTAELPRGVVRDDINDDVDDIDESAAESRAAEVARAQAAARAARERQLQRAREREQG